MSKYSYEFKKEVVNAYQNGDGGYEFLAKKYNIPSKTRIEEWIKRYQAFGDEGLKRSLKKKIFF